MTDIAQQLKDLEARRKRWMTRLTRAHTALKYLEAKRLRLLKRLGPSQINPPSLGTAPEEVIPEAIAPKPELSTGIGAAPQPGVVAEAVKVLEDNDMLPDFLRRGQAAQKAVDKIIEDHNKTVDVDKLKAERKAKEKAERSKMPLTGKAAMAAIRRKK